MGFQEILRALPMTDPNKYVELLDNTNPHIQKSDYEEYFKRQFTALTHGHAIIEQRAPQGRNHRSLSHFIMSRADPLCASYSHSRRDDLAEYVRHKMLEFVNNATHVAALGRKKCYEAGWFFERPNPYFDSATPQHWVSLSAILTALLGASVIAQPEESTSRKPTAEIVLYGGRHKWVEMLN